MEHGDLRGGGAGFRNLALQPEDLLIRVNVIRAGIFLLTVSAFAQPRIDNVLARMVPPATTSLVGVRMNEIKDTAFYREIMQQGKMPSLDQFSRDTGFDPRRDVRELLFCFDQDRRRTAGAREFQNQRRGSERPEAFAARDV